MYSTAVFYFFYWLLDMVAQVIYVLFFGKYDICCTTFTRHPAGVKIESQSKSDRGESGQNEICRLL